ncbi:MAG: hypothetical protein QOJ63_296 [Solirubrobacteraceae bacterium]|nr:hypothetical protein [Solirubrobacteraceae bacterium]
MTPTGVRDGDPAALAGLCDRRGAAVIAYCEVVAGRAAATVAAAEAFGSFRETVVAAGDLGDVNPEALLIGATRHAAARHVELAVRLARGDAPMPCVRVPALLAARADRSITLVDHDWLDEHLASCWTCRAPVARFEAADRAYRDPPVGTLEPDVAAMIVAAMSAAAPVLGADVDTQADADELASANGSGVAHATPAGPDAEHGYVDQPTAAYQIGDVDFELEEPPAEADEPHGEPSKPRATMRGVLGRAGGRRPARGSATATPSPPRQIPLPSATAMTRRDRRRPRLAVVLPIALVIVALVVALLFAGVFGGGEPASVPQSFAPRPSTPTKTPPPRVVVVPGVAATSSAAAVERAKARSRATSRRRAKVARTPARSAATAPATDAATAPPARAPARTQAPARNENAASPPAQKPRSRSTASAGGTKPKINADTGATGAEQLPKARDTSNVPDLAPPVEPAPPPG